MNKPFAIGTALCFVLAAGIIMSSCTKQQADSASEGVAGQYVLVSVDGKGVPATVSHGGVSLKVLSGAFTISADRTCSSRTVFVLPAGNETERKVAATYTLVGSELTMQWEGAGVTVGTIEGNIFTMNNEGILFVYKK